MKNKTIPIEVHKKQVEAYRSALNDFLMEGRSTLMAFVLADCNHPALKRASRRIGKLLVKYGNF